MKTIRLKSRVNRDGLLQVELPEHCNEELEVLIVYQPAESKQHEPKQKRQWSQEFLDLFGAWQGEPLQRAPQEAQPDRDVLL